MNENKYPFISNPRDPRFLALRSLQTHQTRSRTGLYIIEGIRHVARAVEHGASIDSVFVDPSVLSSPFGQKLAHRLRKSGIPGIRLSHQLYRDLTLACEPQGFGAILRQRLLSIDGFLAERNSLYIAVESIESPGNLGTIIRTAEAAGVAAIFILDPVCDPYDPATVRATMGSLFAQKLIRCSPNDFSEWTKSNGVAVVGSSPAGLMHYKALRYRFPSALAIGSEKRGLSDQALGLADFVVRIPMHGGCDSLNAAVAAGVLLFEMSSQRNGDYLQPRRVRYD